MAKCPADNPLPSSLPLQIEYRIDMGAWQRLVSFRGADFASAGAFAGFFRLDTDGDGVGDGLQLGLEAQTISRIFTAIGNTLDMRFVARVNAGGEEFAVDSFMISSSG